MGWSGGTEIFDDMCKFVFDAFTEFDENSCKIILSKLANSLENQDWDCQSDSDYYDNPIVQSVFKELHPEWLETEDSKELQFAIKERNDLAKIAYEYIMDYGSSNDHKFFIESYENGYYK